MSSLENLKEVNWSGDGIKFVTEESYLFKVKH